MTMHQDDDSSVQRIRCVALSLFELLARECSLTTAISFVLCYRSQQHITRRGAPGALSAPQDDSHNDVGKGCRFVLYKVGSINMTVAINALYLMFVHFYALALLASRFFSVYCAWLC